MKHRYTGVVKLAVLLVLASLAAGCARKTVQTPPASTSAGISSRSGDTGRPAQADPDRFPSLDLRPAFFDYDSYALRHDARLALDQSARTLREKPEVRITVEGHCDERGTAEYNQALGERRALAARKYLVGAGIDPSRIQVTSYGKERPFADGSNEEAWAQNRRAHLVTR